MYIMKYDHIHSPLTFPSPTTLSHTHCIKPKEVRSGACDKPMGSHFATSCYSILNYTQAKAETTLISQYPFLLKNWI